MRYCLFSLVLYFYWALVGNALAQTPMPIPTLSQTAYLPDCIQYALQHQPIVQQALIDQEITGRNVRSALADWYPQIAVNYDIQRYLKLPVTLVPVDFNNPDGPRRATSFGLKNISNIQLGLTQNIFNRDILLASRTADAYRAQANQTTVSNKIDVVVNVSKAFYDLIITQRQVEVLNGDIARLQRSLQDANNQYQSGIVDKTDVQRATITLNNTRAQLKQYRDLVGAKQQILKQTMGYPPNAQLAVTSDSLQIANEVVLDTAQLANPQNRIEYQLLQTQGQLLEANARYSRQSYLPSVSANANYNFVYQNNRFSQLYAQNYPNSLIALTLSLPIYQGGRRVEQIKIADLQVKRLQWDLASLTSAVDAECAQALATYKGSLANYNALRENLELAQDVYRIVSLQYRSGIRAYLDVTVAEGELRTARLSLYSALYQVLSSKLDVQRALGAIRF